MEVLKSSFEGDVVKCYDFFFLPKEKVTEECRYIMDLFERYHAEKGSLLDVGCGTGAYSEAMANHYDKVVGVDASKDMISYAKSNHACDNVVYEIGDARDEKVYGEFDTAISLAHVIGYQLSNESVRTYLAMINKNLKNGGLFVFNFYNAMAFFDNKLEPHRVCKKNDVMEVTRLSSARNNAGESCLDLDYYYLIGENGTSHADEIHEKMRYFTRTEIELFLEVSGFSSIGFFGWGTDAELTPDKWNAGCMARKVKEIE